MVAEKSTSQIYKHTIAMVALGYWSAALTNGALRVVLPVYLASVGVSISRIAFLFFLFKFAEIFAPMGIGVLLNRWGYKRTFLTGLAIHSLISALYLVPSFVGIYVERFIRGMLYFADMSSVYVKHFAANNEEFERHRIDEAIDLRTLHEIYFPAFRAAVEEAGVWAVMNAYNRINGEYCAESATCKANALMIVKVTSGRRCNLIRVKAVS